MRLSLLTIVMILAASSLLAAPGACAVPWLEFNARLGTYAMDDVNDDIRNIEAVVAPLKFDEIDKGFGLGAAAGIRVSPTLDIGVRYERIFAKSDVSDWSGGITYDFDANAFLGVIDFRFPTSGRVGGGIGVGAGIVRSAGEVELTVSGAGSLSGDVEGSGPLLQGHAFLDMPLSPRVSFLPAVGYRYAKVGEIEINGIAVKNPDGSDYSVDYSGVFLSVALRILLGG